MDFVSGGTLSGYIETVNKEGVIPDMERIISILKGISLGMEYLHTMEPVPILHRDLKSENVLLTQELESRIADLGEARAIAFDRAMTMVGTNGYTAPEVLRGEQ